MKKIYAVLFAALFFGSISMPNAEVSANVPKSFQRWLPCTVDDPTGTPLNVRQRPNGRIITTLRNGSLVAIDDRTAGNRWSRISFNKGRKKITGYVLRDYLSCQ